MSRGDFQLKKGLTHLRFALPAVWLSMLFVAFYSLRPLASLGDPHPPRIAATRPGERDRIAANWLSANWHHRTKITVRGNFLLGITPLAYFPLAIDGQVVPTMFARARPDGRDILITKGDGVTVLPSELVAYDSALQTAEIWFRADILSLSAREFYVYYANPDTTVSSAEKVWTFDYAGVYHFQENPGLGVLKDSSPHGSHASSRGELSNWTASDVTDGKLGQAWLFNGTSHWIDADAISTQDSSFVISCWLINTTQTTDFAFHGNPGYWHVSSQINETNSQPDYQIDGPYREVRWNPKPLALDGNYHYFNWVFDGVADTILFYYDGIKQNVQFQQKEVGVLHYYSGHPINPHHDANIGIMGPMFYNPSDLMHGSGDEFRVSEGTHSESWIFVEFNNQKSPRDFFITGPEEQDPTLVHLQLFVAERVSDSAVLRWRVLDASADHVGFDVYRDDGSGDWTRLNAAPLSGLSDYSFTDPEPPSSTVDYWLAELTFQGETLWYGPATLRPRFFGALPALRNAPNPFSLETTIRCTIPTSGHVLLRIFDPGGHEVCSLFDRTVEAGMYEVTWDGRNGRGIRLSSGVYFYRLETARGSVTRKLVLR